MICITKQETMEAPFFSYQFVPHINPSSYHNILDHSLLHSNLMPRYLAPKSTSQSFTHESRLVPANLQCVTHGPQRCH